MGEKAMGTINWLAVFLAAALGQAVALVWYGPLFRSGRDLLPGGGQSTGKPWLVMIVLLVGAIMLGHAFARIGEATLAAKPHLYFMQSGGVAIAFVIPAIWLSYLRMGVDTRTRLVEAGYWLAAYLAMGTAFWALG